MKSIINKYLRSFKHVTPAKAGVHLTRVRMFPTGYWATVLGMMDSRLRGNDGVGRIFNFTILICVLILFPVSAKNKDEIDPAEIRKLNAELSRLKKENKVPI